MRRLLLLLVALGFLLVAGSPIPAHADRAEIAPQWISSHVAVCVDYTTPEIHEPWNFGAWFHIRVERPSYIRLRDNLGKYSATIAAYPGQLYVMGTWVDYNGNARVWSEYNSGSGWIAAWNSAPNWYVACN